eukprot:scaffold71874_cov33-Phaeocystis_antarctica.AAC.1
MPRRRGATDFGGGCTYWGYVRYGYTYVRAYLLAHSLTHSPTAQAGAAARAERLREWHALAVGNTISGRDVGLALQELDDLQVSWLSPLSCSKNSMVLKKAERVREAERIKELEEATRLADQMDLLVAEVAVQGGRTAEVEAETDV